MHSRRAILYKPGDDRRKIEKTTTLDVDSICMDMEDGWNDYSGVQGNADVLNSPTLSQSKG